jgi:transcription initiation factor TFIIIB Brf1 subunit/transcription initiation factor TFIIB
MRHGLDMLNANERTRKYAESLAKEIRGETFYTGKRPSGIAASIIYVASVLDYSKALESKEPAYLINISQERIATALNVGTATVREGYKSISKHVNLDPIYR